MRKHVATVLALCMCVMLAGCGAVQFKAGVMGGDLGLPPDGVGGLVRVVNSQTGQAVAGGEIGGSPSGVLSVLTAVWPLLKSAIGL